MNNNEIETIQDFNSYDVSKTVVKNWSLTFKDKEITGTYVYENDTWGFTERHTKIDEVFEQELTEDEIDEILEYVVNNI